jgi:hypothetical protein
MSTFTAFHNLPPLIQAPTAPPPKPARKLIIGIKIIFINKNIESNESERLGTLKFDVAAVVAEEVPKPLNALAIDAAKPIEMNARIPTINPSIRKVIILKVPPLIKPPLIVLLPIPVVRPPKKSIENKIKNI